MAGTSPAKTLRKWLDMTGIHSNSFRWNGTAGFTLSAEHMEAHR